MIKEIIEKMGTLIPLLTLIFGGISIRSLFISFYTSLSYDSFDMRLLPRDKFAMIKFKKNISVFLIIIPMYCSLAFLLAYEAILLPIFGGIVVVLFFIFTLGMILSYIVFFLEYLFIKSASLSWLHWLRIILGKLSLIYKFNTKAKYYITLTFLLLTLTMLAYGYIADIKMILTSLTEYLVVMFVIAILLIYSLLSENKPVDYIFIEENDNLSNLLENNDIEKELKLEYFLSDSIAVLSTEDRVYRVIKRISESKSTYEIYKSNE